MPFYEFWCDCGARRGVVRPMDLASCGLQCKECNSDMYRDYGCNAAIFEPYTEPNFNGKPILVTSAKHRDELCKEFRVSPDKCEFTKPKPRKTVAETIDYDDVAKACESESDEALATIRQGDDDQRRDSMGGDQVTQEIPLVG